VQSTLFPAPYEYWNECKYDNRTHTACEGYDAKKYCCQNKGGVSCSIWKHKTNLEIGARMLPFDDPKNYYNIQSKRAANSENDPREGPV